MFEHCALTVCWVFAAMAMGDEPKPVVLKARFGVNSMTFDSKGRVLAVASAEDIRLWDVNSHKEIGKLSRKKWLFRFKVQRLGFLGFSG